MGFAPRHTWRVLAHGCSAYEQHTCFMLGTVLNKSVEASGETLPSNDGVCVGRHERVLKHAGPCVLWPVMS